MELLDFGFSPVQTATPTVTQTFVPEVTQTVTVVASPSQAAGYAMKDDSVWGWSDLRDFVVREIESRHGPQIRDPKKEAAIFKSFMARWGDQSISIARVAFGPVFDGMWRNAPIAINRFCKASDPYFAAIIAARL